MSIKKKEAGAKKVVAKPAKEEAVEKKVATELKKEIAKRKIEVLKLEDVYKQIDFPVEKRPLYILDKHQKPLEAVGMNAIVRTDTQDVLSVMSKSYNLVSHRFMLEKAIECLEKTGVTYNVNRLQMYENGSQVFVEFTLPKYQFEVTKGDEIDFRVHFKNSYNGTYTFDFSCGFYRLVCTNGLVVGTILERIRKKHTPSLNVEQAVESLAKMIEMSREVGYARMIEMSNKKIGVDNGVKMIADLIEKQKIFPKKYLEPITLNFRNKIDAYTNNSLFDIYNAFSRELNGMDDRGIHPNRTHALNMKAFEGVYQYVTK